MGRLVAGNNAFAWELYHSLQQGPGNLVFSPFSISLAFAMTYAGARGDTASQIQNVLHFDADQARLHSAFNALDLALESSPSPAQEEEQPLQLRIANALWAEQTVRFLPDFLDTLAVNYGAGIQLVDFLNRFEAVRDDVNRWVEQQTEGRIKDLVPPGAFNPDTRLALVNAIYFKADWLQKFDPKSTRDAAFNLLNGTQVTRPAMNANLRVAYGAGDGWQMVELPYAGETAAMLILVPDQGRFEEVQAGLNNESFDRMLASMQPTDLMLSLPKFKFDSSFGLADQLAGLGMPAAFAPGQADFSGMNGGKDLFVSSVIHKAFVAVDEAGTEAAAATGVMMATTGMMVPPLILNIDRPFIFAIRHTGTGQILFIGRVVDPSQ
jgi:serpin B